VSHLTRAIRFVRHWHARAGVLLIILFLFLACTGLALNHTDALGLSKRNVSTKWLMHWYGLKPSAPTHGYLFKEGYLVAGDGHWVMDGQVLAGAYQTPVGAVEWRDMRAVADAGNLYLYTSSGQLIDKLSGSALPNASIKRLGILGAGTKSQLVLETAGGNFATEDGLSWQPLTTGEATWSHEQVLSGVAQASVNKALAPALPLERIILDTHSGRIFGRYGPLVMDIAAIGLIILSLSGGWIYWRTVRRRTKHQ
jgi:uncharacterized iron-regulated membrane protein